MRSSVSGTPMSLLKLASLQSVASFCLRTDAINSFTVVLPFEPPTQTTGSIKSFRYAAANFLSAAQTSLTTSTAHFGSFAGIFFCPMTTAATPLAATSLKKSWPSKCSPLMAKNKSPACAFRESVQTFLTIVSAAPRRISPSQASTTNFKERSSTKYSLQQKRGRDDGGDGFIQRACVIFTAAAGIGFVQRRDLKHAHFRIVQIGDAPAALRGNLFGAGAGVPGGVGEHFDFLPGNFCVKELRPLGGEQNPLLDQRGRVKLRKPVNVA